jgi:hypothetical protein
MLRANSIAALLILSGCGADAPPAAALGDDIGTATSEVAATADDLVCRQDDGDQVLFASASEQLFSATETGIEKRPFRCLRLLGAADISSSSDKLHVVNIVSDDVEAPGQLRIPLHEIKTKGFLRDRSVAILSDGKQFAALEKECSDIKASGVADVIALLPTGSQSMAAREELHTNVPVITSREFVSERAYGVWHFVDLTSGAGQKSPLFRAATAPNTLTRIVKKSGSGTGLERTLVISDDGSLPSAADLSAIDAGRGQTFVLAGGMQGFSRFQAEAIAMARARSRPRINERGCNG